MASKRMFDLSVIGTDEFMEMPDGSQVLYFYLSMYADDDGFVDKYKQIMRMTGKKEDDFKILVAKSFVIPFDTGVIVIRHWKINNCIRGDRYKPTIHNQEKAMLEQDCNGIYNICNSGIPMVDQCVTQYGIPMVDQCVTQYSIDKNSIDKNSIEKNRIDKNNILNIKERKKEEKTFDEIINDYTSCVELESELKEFLKMRKLKKKPMTNHALSLALNKLDKLAVDDEKKIQIVQQSIEKCWDTFYEVKSNALDSKISFSDITIV